MALHATSILPRAREARRGGDRAAGSPALGWLARAGLVARGVVYGVVGGLALALALGAGGKTTSQQGAMRTIADAPLGKAVLVVLAVGLAGYAAWRLLRGIMGHGAEQRDEAGDRVAAIASGIAYAALCVTAVQILLGNGGSSGSPRKPAGGVLEHSGGRVLVVIAGLVLLGVAAYQLYKGVAEKFLDDAKTGEMGETTRRVYTALGVVGHVARAVVFALIGFGLGKAALTYDPKDAVGLDGALQQLAHAPLGPVVLGVVAAGLVAFALYSLVDARYRKV